MVELAIRAKVASVLIQREVDVSSVALNHDRVPVMIIHQAAAAHRRVAHDRTVLVAACLSQNHKCTAFTL